MGATHIPTLLDTDFRIGETVDYMELCILKVSQDRFIVQVRGHDGTVWSFNRDDINSTLVLIDQLNDLHCEYEERFHSDDEYALIEWAGRIITFDKESKDDFPDEYTYISDAPDRIKR